jgi:hypothetical protein
MAAYTIINGTDADLSNVNAGGTDVGAYSYRDGVVLTSGELATLLDGATFPASHADTPNIAVIADQTGNAAKEQMKRSLALAMFFLNPLA